MKPSAMLTVPDVLPMLQAYLTRPTTAAGGWLHIYVEDCNLSDGAIAYCEECARQVGDVEAERLAQTIRQMTRTQRMRLRELWWGSK